MSDFINRSLRKLWRRLYKSAEIDGLSIAAFDDEALFKVREALRFIKTHDPRRAARIGMDLDSIWITLLAGPDGQFGYSDYTSELDERFVACASPEEIASVIVHEATHARLWRRGIRYSEDIRHRVEAVCVRRQQAFAFRLPSPAISVEQLAPFLDLPPTTWSNKAFYRNHLRGSVDVLRHLNMPPWLIGLVLRRHRSRRRRQRRAASLSRPAVRLRTSAKRPVTTA